MGSVYSATKGGAVIQEKAKTIRCKSIYFLVTVSIVVQSWKIYTLCVLYIYILAALCYVWYGILHGTTCKKGEMNWSDWPFLKLASTLITYSILHFTKCFCLTLLFVLCGVVLQKLHVCLPQIYTSSFTFSFKKGIYSLFLTTLNMTKQSKQESNSRWRPMPQ